MPEPGSRRYDIVVLGATGFTGGLAAAYLARNAPAACRWALAGRDQAKLAAVRTRLTGMVPTLTEPPLLTVDVNDARALRSAAESTRVLVTTVGPYLEHGDAVVAACAAAGTDYVDLSGEPEFVDRSYLRYHGQAVQTGARLVHCCGFDSVPHDLGALFTVRQLASDLPVTLRGVVRAGGALSGGTFASALGQSARSAQLRQAAVERRKAEQRPGGRQVRSGDTTPRRDRELGYWLLPLPTIDPAIVKRSAAALEEYGPQFSYSHFAGFERLPVAAGTAVGALVLVAAAQVPPVRELIRRKVPQGEGPSEVRRSRGWFTVDFVAEAGERRLVTKVSGGDPGYDETAKMVSESALSLAFDDNPATAGQVTPAQAMGEALLDRLRRAGISFSVVSAEPPRR